VFGLDDAIARLGAGGGAALALLVAVLLGVRHATDPDHLTAVSSLILGRARGGSRRAAVLGLSWGLGHALTLTALGLPFVLFGDALPARVEQAAEIAIGLLIIGLAVRLLVRWRRGYFHVHPHRHGELVHAHPHVHERSPHAGHDHARAHEHPHAEALGRTPLAAFGIGLVHGVGGSAGAGILLVGTIADPAAAALALAVFAVATAVAMGAATLAFGHLLSRRPVAVRLEAAVPVLGVFGMLFGLWYALGSVDAVPYVL
jgi:ABC-type nickel/cobalt efflux system permease component RcnA